MATLKGALALRCEVKLLREWLRIRCQGASSTGGTPAGIRITEGGEPPDTRATHQAAVMTLVTTFVEGTELHATFAWSDKSYPLAIRWPSGTERPRDLGSFEGAPSPPFPFTDDDYSPRQFRSFDRLEPWMKMYDRLCNCYKASGQRTDCHSVEAVPGFFSHWHPHEDCDRSYANDCEKLLRCAAVWPSVQPQCLPGHVLGPSNSCYQQCQAASDCPQGKVCAERTEFPAGTGGICWKAE